MAPLDIFRASLSGPDLATRLGQAVIGKGVMIDGPLGPKPLRYADYVASGRALRQIEDFVMEHVLPYYANTHTEASYCGAYSTRLREAARAEIGRIVGAGPDCRVIFSGSGATSGLNQIVGLLDIGRVVAAGGKVVVLIGPYEHHSNILPWRESGAEVVEITEGTAGGPDMLHLEAELVLARDAALVVGSFSAMSNVTGIVSDTDAVTRLLKRHGALAIWDYAGGAPYIDMQMQTERDAAKDAIVFSAHKFPGGPAASGVAVIRETVVCRRTPTRPGGGTVTYVSSSSHLYLPDFLPREESGTPDVVGDIRAALVLMVKEALGQDWIDARNAALRARALAVWEKNPAIRLLGNPDANRPLPLFSFILRDGRGQRFSHMTFTRMLSDHHGIQVRGGCSCAGPYGHRLLDVSEERSHQMRAALEAGQKVDKPGWVRVNLSYLLSDAEADEIIHGIDDLARRLDEFVEPEVLVRAS